MSKQFTQEWYNEYLQRRQQQLAKAGDFPRATPESYQQALPTGEAGLINVPRGDSIMTMAPTTDQLKLNKTEKAYHEWLKLQGHPWIGVQCITLKLGDDCRYTPDFWVLDRHGQLIAREVKGFWRDDAKVKIKVAARMYPFIRFDVVTKLKDRLSLAYPWTHEPVKP